MFDFKQRAEALGISPNDTFRGVLSIPDAARLREILDDGTGGETGKITASLVHKGIAEPKSANLTRSLSRRLVQHAYGGAELSAEDKALVADAPIDANVISIPEKTIDSEWNLNDETPEGAVIVSIGTLTIKDGGYIVVSNRMLDLTIDTIVRDGATPPAGGKGIFNILGATGAAGSVGDSPDAPGQAGNGAPGNCSSAGIAGKSGGDGTPGDTGATGGTGLQAGDGKASLEAIIRITSTITSSVPLMIYTQSGIGGKGGAGGAGSKGGQGGNGGGGATCGCTGSSGGSGAQGGKGGTGGTGGPGGNGVDAAGNVIVHVPAAVQDKLSSSKADAPPGDGGDPGPRGPGGDGGSGGGGGKHNDGGSAGGIGPVGEPGVTGARGTNVGHPADIRIQPF